MDLESRNTEPSENKGHARPISDYYFSKGKKLMEKQEKGLKIEKNVKTLYNDALERISRKEAACATIQEDLKRKAESFKPTVRSEKLSEFKKCKIIDEALKISSDPQGFINLSGLQYFLSQIDLLLPTDYLFKNLKAKLTYLKFETEIIEQTWKFINPGNCEFVLKENLYDFIMILLDKNIGSKQKEYDLKKLSDFICKNSEACFCSEWSIKKFISEFEKISQNQKIYASFRQKQKFIEESTKELEKNYQFQPKINETPSSYEESEDTKRFEQLYRKHKETEDKILCSRLTAMEKELGECTFAPKILKNRRSSASNNSKIIKDTTPDKKNTSLSRLEKELEECTFKPIIIKEISKISSEVPRGFNEHIEKSKKAILEKQSKKDKEKISYGENYEKFKMLKFNPPSFLERSTQIKPVILYVDVNVAPGKKGKLAFREGDDPKEVADNFCKVYSLGKDYKEFLEISLAQQLSSLEPKKS